MCPHFGQKFPSSKPLATVVSLINQFLCNKKAITMQRWKLASFIFLFFCASGLRAQQEYSGNDELDCDNPKEASYLYTCNGPERSSCRAFLIYKSQPDYNSTTTISRLFSSDSSLLALMNNVSDSHIFPTNKEVIVPVDCSCSGQYYQANTSFVLRHNDSYYALANDQFQGLSSCSALFGENSYDAENLPVGLNLLVPLRCACPTSKQTKDGAKYLLTYSINENDTIPYVSERFNVSENEVLSANGLIGNDAVIYPFTTLLIPLRREPLSSQTITIEPIDYAPRPVGTLIEVNRFKRSKRGLRLGLGGAGVASLVVLLCLVSLLLLCRRRRRKMRRIKGGLKSTTPKEILNAMAGIDRILKVFDADELKAATKDFSPECRIEGSVYCGTVGGGTVAIKRVSRDVSKEVNILYKLNHFNLISLVGIGMEDQHWYLVYEYMENGSLRDWLDDPGRSGLWNWTRRVQIAVDIATGLDYLHNFSYPPYVHKDIKSSNVLLDGSLRAKITNFTLARLSDCRKEGSSLTRNVDGTLGYMAPEYLECGMVTPKLDVYSFGVVLSELITGKPAVVEHEGRDRLLSGLLTSIVEGKNAQEVLGEFMDPNLRRRSPMALVREVAELCVACFARDLGKRPKMNEVVSALSRIQRDSEMWALAYQEN